MKTLVLGNSHVACVIQAWRQSPFSNGREMSFFVKSGGLSEFTVSGSEISAASSDFSSFLERLSLPKTVDLATFDTIALVGSELSIFHVVNILNRYRVLDWPMRQDLATPALTEGVLRLALSEALNQSNGGRILKLLRGIPQLADKKIAVLPQPFPSERALGSKGSGIGFRRLIKHRAAKPAAAIFSEELFALCNRYGAVYQPQPRSTITHDCLTVNHFTEAARRLINLEQVQPVDDIIHANVAYGNLLVDQILAL